MGVQLEEEGCYIERERESELSVKWRRRSGVRDTEKKGENKKKRKEDKNSKKEESRTKVGGD